MLTPDSGHSPGGFAGRGEGGGDDEARPKSVVVAEEEAQQDGEAQREAALGSRQELPPAEPEREPAGVVCSGCCCLLPPPFFFFGFLGCRRDLHVDTGIGIVGDQQAGSELIEGEEEQPRSQLQRRRFPCWQAQTADLRLGDKSTTTTISSSSSSRLLLVAAVREEGEAYLIPHLHDDMMVIIV